MAMKENTVLKEIRDVRTQLLNHKLYVEIKTDEDLKTFMFSHVYAVWDFMSLLKALQNSLTCTTTPWIPKGNPDLRYLINEIVLAEETDIDQNGNRLSHYEMYLNAMRAAGVSTENIQNDVIRLSQSDQIIKDIESSKLPSYIKQFLTSTFSVIKRRKDHEIAAAFTYGREDLIPEMFTEILGGLSTTDIKTDLEPIRYYFNRHIELDGDEHGPMAHKMVAMLCGDDPIKWQEAAQVSKEALESRIALFDGILKEIRVSKHELVEFQ
jgi:pyrroloquinoline quinone (PQQ) biosynthesis protein C